MYLDINIYRCIVETTMYIRMTYNREEDPKKIGLSGFSTPKAISVLPSSITLRSTSCSFEYLFLKRFGLTKNVVLPLKSELIQYFRWR